MGGPSWHRATADLFSSYSVQYNYDFLRLPTNRHYSSRKEGEDSFTTSGLSLFVKQHDKALARTSQERFTTSYPLFAKHHLREIQKMKNNTDGLEVLSAGSDTMEWVGQGPDTLTSLSPPQRHRHRGHRHQSLGDIRTRAHIRGRNCKRSEGNSPVAGTSSALTSGRASSPSTVAPALHTGKALSITIA